MLIWQEPVPEQAPLQTTDVLPMTGVSVTTVPGSK